MTRDSSRLRTATVGLVSISLFAALFARLWFLQIMNAGTYDKAANIAAYRTIVEPAPRGRILDRNGLPLVDNKSTIVVTVDTQALIKVKGADAMLSRLASLLNQYLNPPANQAYTKDTIRQRLRNKLVSPYKPVVIAAGVPQNLEVYLVEHESEFPAVNAERQTLRTYPFGTLAAQVLGYVGPIPDTYCPADKVDCKVPGESIPYQKDDDVGRTGAEAAFEQYLRGVPGQRKVEVDRTGAIVRTISETPPVPGDDVYLTIDANAQAVAEKGVVDGLAKAKRQPANSTGYIQAPAGSMVVVNPQDGQVIALASSPTYDPSAFVPAISADAYNLLTSPESHYPFTDRAIAGQYPPGSTFKLVTSIAGLRAGLITPDTVYVDGGSYRISGCTSNSQGCVKYGDNRSGNGPVDLRLALTLSSDPYYYKIGDEIWGSGNKTEIQDVARQFGFGSKTGIELSDEQPGSVLTADTLKKLHDSNPAAFPNSDWFSGNNANLAIGQDVVTATPIQLANAYATFANKGTRYQPTILLKVAKFRSGTVVMTQQPKVLGHVDIPQDWWQAMLDGFTGVTSGNRGTAAGAFASAGYPMGNLAVAGKTGTSQNNLDPKSGRLLQPNSLFAGFGPVGNAQYSATAVFEQAGYGADVAAPAVVDFFLPLAKNGQFPQVQPVNGDQALLTNTGQTDTGGGSGTSSTTGAGQGPTTGSTILPLESPDPSDTTSTTTHGSGG